MSSSISGLNLGNETRKKGAGFGYRREGRRQSAQSRSLPSSDVGDTPYMPNAFDAPPVQYVKGEGFFSRWSRRMDTEEGLDHDYY